MTSSLWQVVPITSLAAGSVSATPAVTIPDGSGGKVARLFVVWNNPAVTTTVPAGWTRPTSGVDTTNGGNLATAMFKRTLQPTDDATSLSVAFTLGASAGVRCAGALIICDAAQDHQTVAPAQTTVNAATQDLPASATATADSTAVALLGLIATTPVNGVNPPSGWTEAADIWTTNATGPRIGCWVASRDTRVTTGTATTGSDATSADTAARSNGYVILFDDATVAPDIAPGSGWRYGSFAMRRAG